MFQEYLGTKQLLETIDRAIINFLFHRTACSLVNGRHAAQIQIVWIVSHRGIHVQYILGKPHTNFQLNLKLKAVLDGCSRDLQVQC